MKVGKKEFSCQNSKEKRGRNRGDREAAREADPLGIPLLVNRISLQSTLQLTKKKTNCHLLLSCIF